MLGKSGWGILLPKRELRCLLAVPESDSPDAVLIRQTKPLTRNWSSAAGWRSLFHTVRVWLLKPFMGVSGVQVFRMVEHVVHECSAGGARSWWEAR